MVIGAVPPELRKSPPNHHIVSRGLQRNFAEESHRIAILDSTTGKLIDWHRAIKSNFVEPGFNEVLLGGGASDALERWFAVIEGKVLNQARDVGPRAAGPKIREALASLFTLHLVRSPAFRTKHEQIMDQLHTEVIPRIANAPEVLTRFQEQYDRPPVDGEIEAVGQRLLEEAAAGRRLLADSTAVQYDRIAGILNQFSIQVLWTEPPLPGFILGDVPFVHAQVKTERYGFRDDLAIGDADLIIGPVARRVAVCFTAKQLPYQKLTTRRMVELVNALFWRASLREVACHPDDVLAVQQMFRRIERLPARQLHRV